MSSIRQWAAFLRHTEQCLFPSSRSYFYFTNLSRSILEIFRYFEIHAQNWNTPTTIRRVGTYSWDLARHLTRYSYILSSHPYMALQRGPFPKGLPTTIMQAFQLHPCPPHPSKRSQFYHPHNNWTDLSGCVV